MVSAMGISMHWESMYIFYLQYTIRSLTYKMAMATPDSYFPFI